MNRTRPTLLEYMQCALRVAIHGTRTMVKSLDVFFLYPLLVVGREAVEMDLT